METSNNTRILIADDEELFLQTTAEILLCEGYRCDMVTNALDGMEALRGQDYDLLIADINMPGNANLDFIRQGRVCFPRLPIILITGYPEIETAIQGIELDIDHYLKKPLEIDLLRRKVSEVLRRGDAGVSPAHARRSENFAQVTGAIAHDLNNMLNVADGYLILSEEFIDPTHRVQVFLEESRRAVRRAAALSRKLLDLSRPNTADRSERFDLSELFRELESMVRVRARTGCETVFTISDTAPRVVGNPDGLFDAIFNLISNALDSLSSGGGVVHVRATEANLDRDFCSVHPGLLPGRHLSIEVIDTGCGIPVDILDKIQEPYFTTKPRGQGTGLGLSIVFRVVREMGGAVDIRSIPGLGAAVNLLLPVNR